MRAISKKIFKVILIFVLCFSFSGCALINLLFQLAPIAASILVEYSPPIQTESGEILSVKALRHIERKAEKTHIVKSEYFLVMLDNKGTEIDSVPLEIGQDNYKIEEFNLSRIDKGNFLLSLKNKNLKKEWKVRIINSRLAFRISGQ
jgi:hypothetical protein